MRPAGIVLALVAASAACGGDHHSTGPTPLPPCGASGTPITLAPTNYVSIDPATDSGCFAFPANASATDSAEYLVVAQAATGSPGQSATFQLQSASPGVTASLVEFPAGASAPQASSPIAVQFDRFLRRAARMRSYTTGPTLAASRVASQSPTVTQATPPTVGSLRTFKVCNNLSCSAFDNVTAKVKTVGQHIAIYVDTLAPAGGLDSADFDTLSQVFDSRLYPLDTAAFGDVSDIDTNSVTIVLMTGTVNHLVSSSTCTTSGYVAGFFFSGDLDPLFSNQFNHGEIFYSIVADPTGKLSCAHSTSSVKTGTPITFTHEFQHMINFVQHVVVHGGDSEEGWLDEGLSKYAEEIAGRSFLPGDSVSFSRYAINDVYDAYQYLSNPPSSPLLIPQDDGTLAEIGACWLFTRYLVDRFGDSMPRLLVTDNVVGSANVAARTKETFQTTVTDWAMANWVSDLPNFTAPAALKYSSWHFRRTFASLNSQDPTNFPRPYPLVPTASAGTAVNISGTLTSGSGAYVRALQAPGAAAFDLRLTGSGGVAISSSIVARLSVIRIR